MGAIPPGRVTQWKVLRRYSLLTDPNSEITMHSTGFEVTVARGSRGEPALSVKVGVHQPTLKSITFPIAADEAQRLGHLLIEGASSHPA